MTSLAPLCLTAEDLAESLTAVRRYVDGAAALAGLDPQAARRLRLAVDEIATNVLVHGYPSGGHNAGLEVRAEIEPDVLEITIEDDGVAYNPLEQEKPTTLDTPLETREAGGLGVYLALRNVDAFRYERVAGRNRNRLIVRRPLESKGAPSMAPPPPAGSDRVEKLAYHMEHVILPLGIALSSETDFDALVERILVESKSVCNADAGTLYLRTGTNTLRFAIVRTESLGIVLGGASGKPITYAPLFLRDPVTGEPNHRSVATHVALTGRSVNIPDIYAVEGFDFSTAKTFDAEHGYRSVSSLTVPLKDNTGDSIGVLQLLNARDASGAIVPFDDYSRLLVEALSSLAAIVLNNHLLVQRQKKLGEIEHDIAVARRIQTSFLPAQMPAVPGWDVGARFQPAREVAGDFYDVFPLWEGGALAVAIADVCDKGVGAALFMALTRSLLRAFALQHDPSWAAPLLGEQSSPALRGQVKRAMAAQIVANAVVNTNAYITAHHLELNMFATLFFGVLDPELGSLVYVNAGHCPPWIVAADGTIRARLEGSGAAVGMFPDGEFGVQDAHLDRGDLLLAFTDGVTDARDPARKMFTATRLAALLTPPAGSVTDLLDRIESALCNYVGDAGLFDDVTLLALRRA